MSFTACEVAAGTAGNQPFTGSLGMDFDVNQDITISSLGAFDDGQNGFNRESTVQIFDRTRTAVPLAELLFGTAATGIQVRGSRFLDLATPLTLSAGFQGSIVASGYRVGELTETII